MRRIQLAKYWPLFWYLLYFDLWNQTVALSDFSLYSKVFVLCMQLCFPVTQHHFCRASFAFTEWVPSRQRVVTGVRPPPVHIVHRPPPSLTCRLLTTYLIFHRWRTTSRWSSSWRSSSAWRERCSEWKIINRSGINISHHEKAPFYSWTKQNYPGQKSQWNLLAVICPWTTASSRVPTPPPVEMNSFFSTPILFIDSIELGRIPDMIKVQ